MLEKHFQNPQAFFGCSECEWVNDPCSLRIKVRFSCEVVHASIHRKLMAIGHAVEYYARAVNAFSAGIKCWHCSYWPRSSVS